MDSTQLLKNAIDFAKQNPDSPQATELRTRIESGMYSKELAQIKTEKIKTDVEQKRRMIVEGDPNKKGIIPEAVDKGVEGFKQIQEGVKDPNILSGLSKIAKGTLKEASAGLRIVFSPLEVATKIASQLPVIKQGVESTNDHIIKPLADVISDSPKLQKFMQENPDADQVISDALTVGLSVVGGGRASEIKAVAEKAVDNYIAPVVTKVAEKTTGAIDAVTGLPKTVKNSIIPSTVKENVAKVLKNTGKKSLKDASTSKALDDATSAFQTIHENAPNIKVTDINGNEKAFVPTEANFFELPQALQQTKKAVYDSYTNIANEAGDAGINFSQVDFVALKKNLEKYQGKGYTPAYARKAKELSDAIDKYGTLNQKDGTIYFKNTPPQEVQDLIQQINTDVNPLSDKAGAQVANDFSSKVRSMLDEKIEKNGNPAYQETRTKYSQLKSIENDVITRYKEALRKAGANPSLIDGIISLDGLMGVITMNPTNIARAGGATVIKKVLTYLKDPEVNMRRVFKLLEDGINK